MLKKGKKVLELVDRHFSEVSECFNQFERFIESFLNSGVSEDTVDLYHKIDLLEHDADATRREIVSNFLEGTLLAQTRKEILQLVESADKIANKLQDIARQLVYEKAEFPDWVKEDVIEIVKLTKEQIGKLLKILEFLFDDYDILIKDPTILQEIKDMEGKVDVVELRAIKKIYDSDIQLSMKNYIKYFISKIADISDLIENISDAIQIMIVFRRV